MKDVKEYYTARELAAMRLPGLPETERNILRRADRETWGWRPRSKGKGREYSIASLPAKARSEIMRRNRSPKSELVSDMASLASMGRREAGMAALPSLAAGPRLRVDARLSILASLEEYMRRSTTPPSLRATSPYKGEEINRGRGLPLVKVEKNGGGEAGIASFAAAYNTGAAQVEAFARELYPTLTPSKIYRWRRALAEGGPAALAGQTGRRGASKIDRQPKLREFIVAMLTEHPHASVKHLEQAARARFAGNGIKLPSRRGVERWVARWKKENAEALLAVANPDEWKNARMSAFGSASERVTRLNQLWEFDSTPADVMLADGRHSLIGVIDVYPRRGKLLVSKTSKAAAIASLTRRALLEWGVPERGKTDQGKDYTSRHIVRVFAMLGVEHILCAPFSPWEKPHIERFFRTFAHGLCELQAGFIGHNVADRAAIEARKSFADRLMTKNETVEVNMTAAEFQLFCDRWTQSVYHHDAHAGLNGKTPFQAAAEWPAPIRRITDERALDVLLAEAPGDGLRTVGKKGLRLDGLLYIAPELAHYIGRRVRVLYDPADAGRVFVFGGPETEFVCVAECPEITGVSREEIAAHAREKQKKAVQEKRAELKALARKHKTKDIAEEILAFREREANLIAFPPKEAAYISAGLRAAADAADAVEGMDAPKEARPVSEEAMARTASAMREEQEQMEDTPEARWKKWLELEARGFTGMDSGEEEWRRIYETSGEYRTRILIRNTLGATADEDGDER